MMVMFLKMPEAKKPWSVAYTTESNRYEQTVEIEGARDAVDAVQKAWMQLVNRPQIGTLTGIRAFRS